MYDYLIVGAGLYGAVFAREATDAGKRCLVIDRRPHIGGNVYTECKEGIHIHKYGPHIFHTNDESIWMYVNRFAKFVDYIYSPVANYKGKLYNLPFNMNTFLQLWGVSDAEEVKTIIRKQRLSISDPKNLEEQALSMVGKDVYETLIKGYTEKQWQRPCSGLPAFIINRLPLRFSYDNNYFNDKYQGIPSEGYTSFVEKLLDGIEVQLNTAFEKDRFPAGKIVYCGAIDEYFEYALGSLEYRTLKFDENVFNKKDVQNGVAVINYTSSDVPFTRTIEHKHFYKDNSSSKSIISTEYPAEWQLGDEPYYPINDEKNNALYAKYLEMANKEPRIIFGGRLGEYKYYDMDKIVEAALKKSHEELKYDKYGKIKIFVSMHAESYVPDNPLLYPIQVGAALADAHFPHSLHDDTGDNISEKNKRYCELTAQYWVWKNVKDAEYYGFYHYRRYFSFNPIELPNDHTILHYDYLSEEVQKEICLDADFMSGVIQQYDIIIPYEDDFFSSETVYQHWCKYHIKDDLDLAIKIIIEKYPEYYEALNSVLNSTETIHCNLFIMKHDLFHNYSEWLFDILSEMDKCVDHEKYNEEQYRALGYLGERLCAVYMKHLIENNKDFKVLRLLRTIIKHNEPLLDIWPAFGDEGVVVTLSCNNSFVNYLIVFLRSLLDTRSKNRKYDIIVLHRDISDRNQQIILDSINDEIGVSLRFANISRYIYEYENVFISNHISIETYFRFFMLNVMRAFKKSVYLDVDIIVLEDIALLYDTDVEGCCLAATRDAEICAMYNLYPTSKEYFDTKLKLKSPEDYFQAGVMVLNLNEIRKICSTNELFKVAISSNYWYWDQDVLNIFCRDKIKYIDASWNVMTDCGDRLERIRKFAPQSISSSYVRSRECPKIVHFAGEVKPWDYPDSDFASLFWNCARKTPVFEQLFHRLTYRLVERQVPQCKEAAALSYNDELKNRIDQLCNENSALTSENMRVVEELNHLNSGLLISGIKEPLYADGLIVKFINWMNRLLPKGSKRRLLFKWMMGVRKNATTK